MKENVLETPTPYCWAVEGQHLMAWKGEYAEQAARVASASTNVSQPFPLYKEPPEHHFANAGKELVNFVGLTQDEVVQLIKEMWGCASIAPQKTHSFACAIEAKLKEKNQ